MADTNVSSSTPRKRRWLRILVWILGIFLLLLVVVYFVGTSAMFLKSFILPKVSASLNAKVTVSDASISPFKQVVLRDLKVETVGSEPLLAASEVRLRYRLMDIIRGNINVDEITLNSPTIVLVENPDGTSNLDPILKAQQQPAKPQQSSSSSKPPQLDIKKIALNSGTIRRVKLYSGGKRDLAELSNVNVTLDNLKNGQTGKLGLASDIKVENNPPAPETNGLLQAKLNANFDLSLTADLKPASIQGSTRLVVNRAEAGLAEAAGFAANLDCNISPTEIKQLALRFQKGDTRLGELAVNGPFSAEKLEGKLNIQVLNIDKNVLNLAGASSGLDFGPTTIQSTNQIELAHAGATITVLGQFNLNQFQITRTNQTTPAMDLRANYDLTVDRLASNAVIRAFSITGVKKQNQFLRGELTSAMTIAWGNVSGAVGDSALNLNITRLDLADWKAFAGQFAPAGEVTMKLQLLSQKAGKQLAFDFNSEIANLTAIAGTNQISGLGITAQARGQAADMDKFNVPEYRFQFARQGQALITASGSATYEKSAQNADAQLNGQIMLARLLQAFPQQDMNITSGTAELKTHVVQKDKNQTVTGSFTLADFSGQVSSNIFRSFGTTADFDVGMTPEQVQIRKCAGKITEGANVGGTFDLSGSYGLSNNAAKITATLANFNQVGLRTFLEPALGDKKLVSVALNANASIQYDPKAASAIKADMSVTNLVVNDPKGQIPATPLAANAKLDASLDKQVAEVRQCMLSLTPTARATNQVQLTGRVDMSQTNATQGNLKLAAESLDLTTYYDLFGGKPAGPEKQPPPAPSPAPQPPPAPGGNEPPPTNSLPFRNFLAELAVGRLYLHELEVTNWQTSVKIDGGKVSVNPCKLAINGAPVSSTVDVDLGVPGYKYDLNLSSGAIPLAPLVNSFSPENKGLLGGTLTAQSKISGVGTTGASLQKTLSGQFDLFSTNLNLSVDSIPTKTVGMRLLKTIVNGITVIPDLVKNSGGASALAGLAGGGDASGSSSDIKKSPIDAIVAQGTMGSGKIVLNQSVVRSPTFIAGASGTIELASVLTNSPLNLPISVYLERGVAEKLKMAGNTPPTDKYAKLPDYLTIKGTIGEPKTQINAKAFVGTALQGLSGLAGKNSGLVQGLGNLLNGSGSAAPAAGTNAAAPATNRPAGNLGGLVEGLITGSQSTGTNAPGATNAAKGTNAPVVTNAPPPATNQSPVNLLNDLFRRKKK